ncbi:MAG TPA: sigma 54-interacting transcriptional regulator [Acidobacteriaceae bacterium]|nr:sigma 54-interacting transcriptional regulator [Acidobacteriaceae bacterium]
MSAHPISTGEEQRHFERLITDVSLPFINSSGTHLDTDIEAALKAICDSLRLDYSALAQWDKAAELFVITHSWVVNGSVSGRRFPQKDIPWLAFSILRGKSIQFGRTSKFSSEAAKDVEAVCQPNMESALFLPLKSDDQVLGFVCFGCSRAEHEWPEDIGDRLHVIAEVFGKTLARSRSEDELVQSQERRALEAEERFRVVIESFPTAVILSDQKGTIIRVNSRTSLAFGYTQEELLGQPIEMLIPHRFRGHHGANWAEFVAQPSMRLMGTGQALFGLRKDGSEFQADVTLSPMQTSENILVLTAITDVTDRRITEQAMIDLNARLMAANDQIRSMKEELEREQGSFKHEIKLESNHDEIVGRSQALLRVLMNAEQVATTDSAVLLLGETGSGKELIARAIHKNSKRAARPMVNVNCAALPASLVENELFGRERGAYTGALTREVGRFELANHSTIFLDEVGELPLELQAKLLRVLQEGEFERLGSSKTIHVDVRLIAATSRDMEAAVREGKFREDLYYRLNVFPIRVPPLRERREDIPMLTWHFLQMLGSRMGRDVSSVRASTMKAFQAYAWPGNVRELRNVIERSLILHQGPVFEADLPEGAGVTSCVGTKIEEVDRDHIFRILERTGWRVRGPGGAAEALGLKPTTLEARMKKLGVARKQRS